MTAALAYILPAIPYVAAVATAGALIPLAVLLVVDLAAGRRDRRTEG